MRHKFNSEASQNRWDDQQEERDDRLLQLKMKELEVLSTVSQKRVPKSDLYSIPTSYCVRTMSQAELGDMKSLRPALFSLRSCEVELRKSTKLLARDSCRR